MYGEILSLEIYVPAIKDETNWTWKCEGKQRFVFITYGRSFGLHEEPKFTMYPRAIESSGLLILQSVKHKGVDQILGGRGFAMKRTTEPIHVDWPAFTKDEPLEIEFVLTPDPCVLSIWLDTSVLAERFRENG